MEDTNSFRPISELTLIYRSEGSGKHYTQPAADLTQAGTLIDPDGPTAGDDMPIVGYQQV